MSLGEILHKLISVKAIVSKAIHSVADDLNKVGPAIAMLTSVIPGAKAAGVASVAVINVINEVDKALNDANEASATATNAPDPTKDGLTVTLTPQCVQALMDVKAAIAVNPPIAPQTQQPAMTPASAPVAGG